MQSISKLKKYRFPVITSIFLYILTQPFYYKQFAPKQNSNPISASTSDIFMIEYDLFKYISDFPTNFSKLFRRQHTFNRQLSKPKFYK